jgi:hypothetical protein
VFERPKSIFNTQKARLNKKKSFGKKFKSAFKGQKSLKIIKTNFWQKQNKAFAQKLFLT